MPGDQPLRWQFVRASRPSSGIALHDATMGLLVEGDSQHDSHLQLRLDNRSFFNTQQSVFSEVVPHSWTVFRYL